MSKEDQHCPKSDMRTGECQECVVSCLYAANENLDKYNELRRKRMEQCSKF